MGYIVKYDSTIFSNPVNKYCIVSVKTADTSVPEQARDKRRYRDHLIRFTAVGYGIPLTEAVDLELEGEWVEGKYGMQRRKMQSAGWYSARRAHLWKGPPVPPSLRRIRSSCFCRSQWAQCHPASATWSQRGRRNIRYSRRPIPHRPAILLRPPIAHRPPSCRRPSIPRALRHSQWGS